MKQYKKNEGDEKMLLDPEERYNLWNDYTGTISKLFSEVEGDLHSKYKPYGKEPDKDTPVVQKLVMLLEILYDFTNEHNKTLEREYLDYCTKQDNLQTNFEAWELGICPKAIQQMTYFERYGNPELKEFFKKFPRKDGMKALLLWREKHGIQLFSGDYQASA